MTFLACAAVLTSAFVLGSCNKNDQNEPKSQMPEVKTEFSIALPNQLSSNGANRMPGTTVQRTPSEFQGMTGITLIPYDQQRAVLAGDKRIGNNIELTDGIASDALGTNSNAKVFEDVSIPVSTASFLFYAKSAKTGTDFEIGALNATGIDNDKELEDITFSLKQINTDPAALYLPEAVGGKLMAYLSSVANAKVTSPSEKYWREYTELENKALHDMYAAYTSIHGLSSSEVARVLTDLYKSLMPTTSPIATAIKTAINNGTYATVDGSGNVTLVSALQNFPGSANLPEGSVDIKWDDSSKAFIKGNYTNMADLDRYVYPAQLWYYVNSPIQTANASRKSMYNNVNDWDAILAAHTAGASVSPRTRAVAITDPIQYAVARLDVQVRLASASMADNSDVVEGAAKNVDCTGSGFPVTAILVGGQQQVKFDFTTNGGTEYTIYDNIMTPSAETTPSTMIAKKDGDNYSDINSTLVLENGGSDVMIAVEMLNDKADFYGAGNQLIPLNGKFYVIAKLVAASATETSGHVFKQDYTTTAKLTLNNLKTAYNTIPDLRTPQLELGFSVDLSWQSGHTYEISFD